jgi:hypothetical protein
LDALRSDGRLSFPGAVFLDEDAFGPDVDELAMGRWDGET